MDTTVVDDVLAHHGVKGMKWGRRKASGEYRRLAVPSGASKGTRQTISDYNSLNDREFLRKHAVSKKRYAKRVNTKGDPSRLKPGKEEKRPWDKPEAVKTKPKNSADIKDARIRNDARTENLRLQANKLNLASTEQQRAKEAKKFSQMQLEQLKNPDAATALRLTRGEKFTLLALGVAIPISAPISLGYAANQRAQRREVESTQRRLKKLS